VVVGAALGLLYVLTGFGYSVFAAIAQAIGLPDSFLAAIGVGGAAKGGSRWLFHPARTN
jgi:hypothetical protein